MQSIQFSFRSFLYNFNKQLKIQPTSRNVNTVLILLTMVNSLLKMLSCARLWGANYSFGGGVMPPWPRPWL